jgi:hypothetical protein
LGEGLGSLRIADVGWVDVLYVVLKRCISAVLWPKKMHVNDLV